MSDDLFKYSIEEVLKPIIKKHNLKGEQIDLYRDVITAMRRDIEAGYDKDVDDMINGEEE